MYRENGIKRKPDLNMNTQLCTSNAKGITRTNNIIKQPLSPHFCFFLEPAIQFPETNTRVSHRLQQNQHNSHNMHVKSTINLLGLIEHWARSKGTI